MLERATLLLTLVVLGLVPSIAFGQEPPPVRAPAVVRAQDPPSDIPSSSPRTPITIGARGWVTTGYSSLSIGTRTIDPLSELRWRGIDSIVGEVNVEANFQHVFLLGSVGGGAIDDGVLIDDDFSASNHQGRDSHTRSDIRGDSGLAYINADVGKNLFHWKTDRGERGFIDVLLGGQYWFEQYVAFGATGFPNTADRREKVSTVDFAWLSLRAGVRAEIPIAGPVGVRFRGYVIPVSYFYSEDIHHLRGDLKHDPSFRDSAWGGFGEQLEGALTYSIWRHRLFAEAGYRYWRVESGSGTDTARTVNGDVHQRFNGAVTERYGPFVGFQFRF